jgi:colanic acid biosynthesis glycosyl transferase WcaI
MIRPSHRFFDRDPAGRPLEILYVSQYFPPECSAGGTRVDDFTRAWAAVGHKVSVLTGFPNYPDGVLDPAYRSRWRRGMAYERRGAVRVFRTWLYPAANRGLWKRTANYVSFALSASLIGPWVAPSSGVVIGTSPQLLVGAAAFEIARIRRLPFVFEVRDLWPESLEAVGQAERGSALYRSTAHLAAFLYRHADSIVVDGEWKRRALTEAGLPAGKISVVRTGVTRNFLPNPESAEAERARRHLRMEFGLEGCFVLLYAGTLGMAHRLETVIEAADRLRERRYIRFLVAGDGAERGRLLSLVRERRLENVLYVGRQPRERMPDFLAAADACLVPLRRSEVFKTAVPSKMFEAMAAAKPVILGVEGEAREILLEAQAGIPVPPEDPETMVSAVLDLQQAPGQARMLGANGRCAVLKKYAREQQAAVYIEILREVSEAGARPAIVHGGPEPTVSTPALLAAPKVN